MSQAGDFDTLINTKVNPYHAYLANIFLFFYWELSCIMFLIYAYISKSSTWADWPFAK